MTKDNVIQAIRNIAKQLGVEAPYEAHIKDGLNLPKLLELIILDLFWRDSDELELKDFNTIQKAYSTLRTLGHFNFDKNDK